MADYLSGSRLGKKVQGCGMGAMLMDVLGAGRARHLKSIASVVSLYDGDCEGDGGCGPGGTLGFSGRLE